uniref:Uncharacterized protein n=1 Tax=Megaselia scalaris TaxID=36166 RepID=T1GKW6_MEGSC
MAKNRKRRSVRIAESYRRITRSQTRKTDSYIVEEIDCNEYCSSFSSDQDAPVSKKKNLHSSSYTIPMISFKVYRFYLSFGVAPIKYTPSYQISVYNQYNISSLSPNVLAGRLRSITIRNQKQLKPEATRSDWFV